MSPVITYVGEKESTLSYISTGGQIEIYLFFKGGPKDIIKAYQNFIGKPTLTPFWSLGWHASAYAYQTQADVQANIDGYKTAGIPLEGVWLDIPYLNAYADFSIDTTAFPDLKSLTDTCHANGQRVIPIIDAGISADKLDNKYI
jgi:alpha-glucosidase (family GH31 glycosyl hydrolase)